MANEKSAKPKDAPEKKEAVVEATEAKGVGPTPPPVVVQEPAPVIPAKPEPEPVIAPSHPEPHVVTSSAPKLSTSCPRCGSNATGNAGGQRHCNQCGASWG